MRMVPNLRCVSCAVPDLSLYEDQAEALEKIVRPEAEAILPQIIMALTEPLTAEEASPAPSTSVEASRASYTGTYDEINKLFYLLGYTNGTPSFCPPGRRWIICCGALICRRSTSSAY